MPLTPPNVSASMIGVKNFSVKLLLRRSNNLILVLTISPPPPPPLRTEMHDREFSNNFNYCLPNCRTERHKNSFIPTMCTICCLPLGRQHTNLDVTEFSTGPSPSRDLCIVEISILRRGSPVLRGQNWTSVGVASGKMSVHFPGDA